MSLLSSPGSPGPDRPPPPRPRGPRQASAEPVREPAALRSPFTTPQRDSEGEREEALATPAPCVAGRGRGAGAPPAPGMRARALGSTFFLPLSRLEPPLACSGERECTDQRPRRAPWPGAPGNVSREAHKLLRVSPAHLAHTAPPPPECGSCGFRSSFCCPVLHGEPFISFSLHLRDSPGRGRR